MNSLASDMFQPGPAMAIRDLTKIFHPPASGRLGQLLRPASARKPVFALNRVNLSIQCGEIFGLVGRNGQGKTTLIKCIASLLQPTHGTVEVQGRDTLREGEAVRGLIGLVSAEERTFYGRLTGWQNLMFYARLYGMTDAPARSRIQELAKIFDFQSMLPRRFQELSSGNKQRMALIRALLIDPPIVLLDEPTRSLDPIAAEELRRVIQGELNRRQGKTIFITSHNLTEVETLCTRVCFLSAGEIKLCATMEDLTRRYFSRERVSLEVRGIPEMNGMACLKETVPSLEWRRESADTARISFQRQAGDETIQRVIREILEHGGAIIGCRTERDGLREIMNTFEENKRSPGDAPVDDGR